MIPPEVLEFLACPLCDERSPLRQVGDYLVCTRDGTGFPIEQGIPRLLPELAIPPEVMAGKIK